MYFVGRAEKTCQWIDCGDEREESRLNEVFLDSCAIDRAEEGTNSTR